MKKLQRLILVQFYLYDAEELPIGGHAAFLGQNGSGKTSVLDAIQIAMLGAHGNYLAFNTQSVGSHGSGRRNPRSVRDYCLGVVDDTGEAGGQMDRKRDNALTYVTLVFEDDVTFEATSIGVCIRASADRLGHEVLGMYVLPGLKLSLSDHLERGEAEDLPLHWPDFEAAVRAQFSAMRRTPFFTTQPMSYIGEMLHALQPKAKSINVRDYLKVFQKSVRLRNIESVDVFVRDYVVEPQSIDRRRARIQIEHFKELNDVLDRVKQQIEDLSVIETGYANVRKYVVRAVTIKALASIYAADERQHEYRKKNNSIRNLFKDRHTAKSTNSLLLEQVNGAKQSYDTAQEALLTKPGAQVLKEKLALKDAHELNFSNGCRRIRSDMTRIAGAIHDLARHKALPDRQHEIKGADQNLAHQSNRFEQGHIRGIAESLATATSLLKECTPALEHAEIAAKNGEEVAQGILSSLMGQVKNAEKDGAPINDDVARIIQRLSEFGIEADPVCSLVLITDAAWQPAIETYLKTNRESLVVSEGREREAISIIRALPERDNPFAAKVIQPYHLRDHRWDESDMQLVGNLLVSENKVALTYLRSLLGSMRCVQTEDELEKNSRALTLDGMLSANFTTSRMRLYSPDKLLFGKRLTHVEKMALQTNVAKAIEELAWVESQRKVIEELKNDVLRLGDLDEIQRRVTDDVAQAIKDQTQVFELGELINTMDTGEWGQLKEEVRSKKELWEQIDQEQRRKENELAGIETKLRGMIPELFSSRKLRNEAMISLEITLKSEDVDEMVLERVRGDIEVAAPQGSYADWIRLCQNRIDVAERNADDAKLEAIQPFQRYLDKHGISLGRELISWRNALVWVQGEAQRLIDTELVEREEQVKAARERAEEAFRNDIAVRMRESIIQMNTTIADINKTLTVCPCFSNGEKYKFQVNTADTHKALHDYIVKVGTDAELDMHSLGDQTHQVIMKLLDDSGTDARDDNPLDDYRTLFNFDLVISRSGRKDTVLSKRLGVGSNGEHLAPFYVIAGAAMTAAYRIDSGKPNTGAGLMLLDEAFYGMDQQNSLAAGRFLNSIGLQMIMAAPEADHSKLAPMLDTIFEINRFEMDVFIDPIKVKEPTRRLLTSDMPSEHPDLVTQMIEAMQTEPI